MTMKTPRLGCYEEGGGVGELGMAVVVVVLPTALVMSVAGSAASHGHSGDGDVGWCCRQ